MRFITVIALCHDRCIHFSDTNLSLIVDEIVFTVFFFFSFQRIVDIHFTDIRQVDLFPKNFISNLNVF